MLYSSIHKKIVSRIREWNQESFYVIAVKNDNIIGIKRIAIGSCDSVTINPYEIQRYIEDKDADGYLIAHTHPYNETSHSFADVCTTNYFKQVIKYTFLGSMIITKKDYDFVPAIWDDKEDTNE